MKLSIAVLIVGALALVGCIEKSSPQSAESSYPITRSSSQDPWPQHYMRLIEKDGVQCMVYGHGQAGGLSCNWKKYNEEYQ